MIRILFILLFTLSGPLSILAQYHSVNQVPNPKDGGTGYVTNPDGYLTRNDEKKINKILAKLEKKNSFQVAVVVVESIGSNVPNDFGTELFNLWGVGHKETNNGLLILFVGDQRRIEFITGYGTETVLPDVTCYNIQQDYMIPFFKDDDYSAGLVAGVRATNDFLEGKSIEPYESEVWNMNQQEMLAKADLRRRKTIRKWVFWGLSWHAVGLVIFLVALLIIRFRYDPYRKYNTIKYFHLWIWAVLFPVTHIFIVIIAKRLKDRYRNMVRFSGKTGEIMHKLRENEEDKYLSKGQVNEELVHSVDYDVWVTEKDDDLLVLSYRPFFSRYSRCPKCGFRTYRKEYDRQIVAPTYSSSGRGEKKYSCSNCNHEKRTTYHIPRLTRSSTTSSGGYSGGSSWSGGSSSWGGGSSGGGGAGSSW